MHAVNYLINDTNKGSPGQQHGLLLRPFVSWTNEETWAHVTVPFQHLRCIRPSQGLEIQSFIFGQATNIPHLLMCYLCSNTRSP